MSKALHPQSPFRALTGDFQSQIDWGDLTPLKNIPKRARDLENTYTEKQDPGLKKQRKIKPVYMGNTELYFNKRIK